MRRRVGFITGSLVFVLGILAQVPAKRLEYEVASIRPAPADRRNGVGVHGGPASSDPTHVRYNFFLLRLLLMSAYGLPAHQISLPARIESDQRYDVVAKRSGGHNQRAGARDAAEFPDRPVSPEAASRGKSHAAL